MIINNINPVLFDFEGLEIRYYGIMFAIGVSLYYVITAWIFKRNKYPNKDFENLILFLFAGLIIGARLGHIVFYNLDYFLANPIEIIKFWHGGLSSHGAAIGLFSAYFAFCFFYKIKFTKYADAISVAMPLTAGFVRIGNFFNSEIVGKPTNLPWSVVFKRLDEDFARHPSQIYEAILAWSIFFILIWIYVKHPKNKPRLFFMFLFILLYFATRFIVEFVKEYPVWGFFNLTTGQYLSIIPIAIALTWLVWFFPASKNMSQIK